MVIRIYVCCDRTVTVEVPPGPYEPGAIPLCGLCRGPMKWKQTREYNPANHGWSTGMQAPAIDFNQTRSRVAPIGDGIEVNSLHDIRRIERESEKMARDGIGQPYIFRKYSQDPSNIHTHTMGPDPSQAPSQDWLRKHGAPRPIDEQAARRDGEMGPGAREELASYLPTDPV